VVLSQSKPKEGWPEGESHQHESPLVVNAQTGLRWIFGKYKVFLEGKTKLSML